MKYYIVVDTVAGLLVIHHAEPTGFKGEKLLFDGLRYVPVSIADPTVGGPASELTMMAHVDREPLARALTTELRSELKRLDELATKKMRELQLLEAP